MKIHQNTFQQKTFILLLWNNKNVKSEYQKYIQYKFVTHPAKIKTYGFDTGS